MAFARTTDTLWQEGELGCPPSREDVTRSAAIRSWTYCETWTRISMPVDDSMEHIGRWVRFERTEHKDIREHWSKIDQKTTKAATDVCILGDLTCTCEGWIVSWPVDGMRWRGIKKRVIRKWIRMGSLAVMFFLENIMRHMIYYINSYLPVAAERCPGPDLLQLVFVWSW